VEVEVAMAEEADERDESFYIAQRDEQALVL